MPNVSDDLAVAQTIVLNGGKGHQCGVYICRRHRMLFLEAAALTEEVVKIGQTDGTAL